jgi:hypothetical protein
MDKLYQNRSRENRVPVWSASALNLLTSRDAGPSGRIMFAPNDAALALTH